MPQGVRIESFNDAVMSDEMLNCEVQALITEFEELSDDKPSTIIGRKAVVYIEEWSCSKSTFCSSYAVPNEESCGH